MEDILVALLCVAVFWLIIRQLRQKQRDQFLDSYNETLAGLDRRLTQLEAITRASATPVPEPQPQPASRSVPATIAPPPPASSASTWVVPAPLPLRTSPPPAPTVAAPQPPPSFAARPSFSSPPSSGSAEPRRSISLEERLGQNWLNKLGIVTLVIGLALFLGYQLRTLGPEGKSAIGLALSVAILAAGIFLERRPNYRIFARAAVGGGWALTFFVTFAIYHVAAMKVVDSQAFDLILMFVVASAMVVHSLRYKSQVVTSLAFLLAFVTVGISQVTLFSLVAGALLASGLIYVSAREYWYPLGLCGLVGVYLNHFLWLHRVLPDGVVPGHPFPQFIPSAALLLLYWLLFRLVYVFRVPRTQRQQTVASITAVLNSIGLMALLKYQSSHPEWAFYALLALGLAEMVLAFLARPRFRAAFIVLSTIASVLLLTAIPFRFSGARWTFFWLLEAELLLLVGIRLPEPVFRRLGLLGGFAIAAKLLILDSPRIIDLRQQQYDPSHHLSIGLTFLCAAILFWLNSELAPRHWSVNATHDFDTAALTLTSYLAAAMSLIGLWILIPGPWTIVAWLALALTLGTITDRLSSTQLALQADLIASCAIIRVAVINLQDSTHFGPITLRAITVSIAAALLYLCARRRTTAFTVTRDYIAPAYAWVAAALVATLLWYELQPIAVAVAWTVFALILFELSLIFRRSFLRHQAYALLAATFVRIFFANLNVTSTQLLGPRLYTVIPLIAVWLWVYHRITAEQQAQQPTLLTKLDRLAATISAWCATIAAASLLYFEVRAAWITIAWSILALILLTTALTLKRPLFTAQSLALLLAAAIRALLFNLFSTPALASTPTTSRVFTITLTCALMFAALPIAFRLRTRNTDTETSPLRFLLTHPEQPFFFVPLALLATLLAVQLRAGMITVGWSVLGVLTFLFALTVVERSFRLAGLALLMLGVAKILAVDIWHAAPTDRYITLIVMGAALLLVSFLYSRYRETLLKFL